VTIFSTLFSTMVIIRLLKKSFISKMHKNKHIAVLDNLHILDYVWSEVHFHVYWYFRELSLMYLVGISIGVSVVIDFWSFLFCWCQFYVYNMIWYAMNFIFSQKFVASFYNFFILCMTY
jgi:hypothetical protein